MTNLLDTDGDGKLDCCDMIRLLWVAPRATLTHIYNYIDEYVVGFPIISSVCTVSWKWGLNQHFARACALRSA